MPSLEVRFAPRGTVLFALSAVLVSGGLLSGCHSNDSAPAAAAVPTAPVVTAERTSLANTLNVAGEFVPWEEVELHAKVAGYIRKMNVDIGDKVHKGEVLATLDVPELQAQVTGAGAGVAQAREQITRARADVAEAQADYIAVHSNSQRLNEAARAQPGIIAQQELDNATAKDTAAAEAVNAAKSSLAATQQALGVSRATESQVTSMADYSHIIAPFDGVVTWRYADPGALIQAGTSNAGSAPVVKVANISTLRLRVPVPESLAGFVHDGDTATINVTALHKTFTGQIARSTDALDPSTRTLQVEIDVPNKDDALTPGMYAEVSLNIARAGDVLAVPITAVDTTSAQPWVYVVDSSDHIRKRVVQTGITTATRVEILSGLQAGERVVSTGLSQFLPGEEVHPQRDALASNSMTGGA
jgi:RND family efflux transporter MFP subunit